MQWLVAKRLQQHMNVIGHHHPVSAIVINAMFEKQALGHLSAALYIPQHTLAGTSIKPSFHSNRIETPILLTSVLVPRLRVSCASAFPFMQPAFQYFLRHRIRQPERHEVNRIRLVHLRQMPLV
jgi:hypothetical protein